MRKVQLGSGSRRLRGWENYDKDVDIRNPLPFPDESVDRFMLEHLIEHVTQHQAYRFLCDCHRVLKEGGVVRVVFPDVKRIYENCDDTYRAFVKKHHHVEATTKNAVEQIIFNFNHLSFWTIDSMVTTMRIAGFLTNTCVYNDSLVSDLKGIDSHWRSIGWDAAYMESSVVEGLKK
jgi:predicted SAM-dependent methyltransferase